MTVIAMTRELATRGKDVAAGLAEKLGLEVIHHELVEHDISERAGLRESEVHRYLEGEASLLERWRIDSRKLSRYTALEILELAKKGNVIVRGWGAVYLLRKVSHVISVRTTAPMAFREDVLMERVGFKTREKARREIVRNDAAHNGAMQAMFGIDWTDASHYAVSFNTQRIPIDDIVDHVVTLTKSKAFKETDASLMSLNDNLIDARIRRAFDDQFDQGVSTTGIETQVQDGCVTLSGAVTDDHIITKAVRLVRDVEGVTKVDNQIERMAFRPLIAS